jgi:hypothetical protein
VGLIDEKSEGRKSRATVPLKRARSWSRFQIFARFRSTEFIINYNLKEDISAVTISPDKLVSMKTVIRVHTYSYCAVGVGAHNAWLRFRIVVLQQCRNNVICKIELWFICCSFI